jgi:hypothetical protein
MSTAVTTSTCWRSSVGGHWGAVAKSNFVGLRFREPVYRTLRELAMSYFEQYYNLEREKTLRGYTGPLNLKRFDRLNWMTADETMELIAQRTEEIRRVMLVDAKMEKRLSLVDERSYQAGLIGADPKASTNPRRIDPRMPVPARWKGGRIHDRGKCFPKKSAASMKAALFWRLL